MRKAYMFTLLTFICVAVGLVLAACGESTAPPSATPSPTQPSGTQSPATQPPATQSPTAQAGASTSFSLTSDAFRSDEAIPSAYTRDGENKSPALSWSGAPANTATFALIVDDPDAPRGVFTHWVLFNLPSGSQSLAEGVAKTERLTNGAVQGRNDGGQTGYAGPCPPAGAPHHYRFTLYALDTALNLNPGASKQDVLQAIEGHVLGQGHLVGTYQRMSR